MRKWTGCIYLLAGYWRSSPGAYPSDVDGMAMRMPCFLCCVAVSCSGVQLQQRAASHDHDVGEDLGFFRGNRGVHDPVTDSVPPHSHTAGACCSVCLFFFVRHGLLMLLLGQAGRQKKLLLARSTVTTGPGVLPNESWISQNLQPCQPQADTCPVCANVCSLAISLIISYSNRSLFDTSDAGCASHALGFQ